LLDHGFLPLRAGGYPAPKDVLRRAARAIPRRRFAISISLSTIAYRTRPPNGRSPATDLRRLGSEGAIGRVAASEADVAFVQLPAQTATLQCDLLGETDIVAVANRETVVPADIRTARFLVWDGSPEVARLFDAHPELCRIAVTNDLALIKRLIDVDLGVAFVPRWFVKRSS
jgi:DNA-binding transcriptional LysR family regulator